MCQDCGCAATGEADVRIHTHHHHHGNGHHHHHHHHDSDNRNRTVEVKQAILAKNDRLAERNRGYFLAKQVKVLNVVSSPGAGKTALLQRTLQDLSDRIPTGIIVGDLETDNDAQRLGTTGAPVVQITTGTVCHLEADMVLRSAQHLDLDALDLLVIENVGNLVCPASYDLGEDARVVLFSTTEGEDKPLKYPTMFKTADLVVINKIDIAEAVGFDRQTALDNVRRIAPQAEILEVSARTGDGTDAWYGWIEAQVGQLATLG